MQNFTNREMELMNFLWSYGKPATSKDMLEKCVDRSWSPTYLNIMLRSLEEKGAIRCCGAVLYGRKYARQFECMLSKEEYYVRLAVDNGVDKKALATAAVGLVKKEASEDQEDLIQELEKIIAEFKERGDEK